MSVSSPEVINLTPAQESLHLAETSVEALTGAAIEESTLILDVLGTTLADPGQTPILTASGSGHSNGCDLDGE